MDAYLQAYPVFAAYPEGYRIMNEEAVSGTLDSLARIRDLCQERDINFLVLFAPVYHKYWNFFDRAQVEAFCTRLAQAHPLLGFLPLQRQLRPPVFLR